MRICIHTLWDITHDYVGGTERFILALAKELNILGFDAFVLCTGFDKTKYIENVRVEYRLPKRYEHHFVKHGEAKTDFLKDAFLNEPNELAQLKALSDYVGLQIADSQADILHLNSFTSAAFLNTLTPIIATQHENDKETDNLWGKGFFDRFCSLLKKNSPPAIQRCTLTAPSAHYASYYTKLIGRPVYAAKQGIALDVFPATRRSIWQKGEQLRILLPSRFAPEQKGHYIALEACQILKKKGWDIKMVISGARKDTLLDVEGFRDLARTMSLLNEIEIREFADMNRAYDEAHVVVSPERFCSYGLSVSEALARGIPTVLTNIPTYREIASGFDHAFFAEVDDPSHLSTQIELAAVSRQARSKRHRITFRMANDMRKCAERYAEIYFSANLRPSQT